MSVWWHLCRQWGCECRQVIFTVLVLLTFSLKNIEVGTVDREVQV